MLRKKNALTNHQSLRWRQQVNYGWYNVIQETKRQPIALTLTVLVIVISLMLPTISYLLWKNSHLAAQNWYPTPNLTIYLNKALTPAQENIIVEKSKKIDNVKNLIYLNKEQTLAEFQQWSGFDNALKLLDENPLPAVMIVTPENADHQALQALKFHLQQISGIDDIRIDDGWFTKLVALTRLVATICAIMSILMIISVFLVIGNSVRLTIFARRKTIHVMKLIGATDGFILRPFLYQGMFLGFISAIFSIIFCHLIIWYLSHLVTNVATLLGSNFVLTGLSIDECVFVILMSLIIGWLSAWITTLRYLKTDTNE